MPCGMRAMHRDHRGPGDGEMQFLIKALDAASRLIIMDGKHPRDELVSLLREKLELYERRIAVSGWED